MPSTQPATPWRSPTRRDALVSGALLSALATIGLLSPRELRAAEGAFAAKSVDEALNSLGIQGAADGDITLTTPDIAENGAVVQIGVQTALPKVDALHVLVEKNLNPLVASYTLPASTEAFLQMRVKMGQTSPVWALVRSDGRWFKTSKETKVTLGGCGG